MTTSAMQRGSAVDTGVEETAAYTTDTKLEQERAPRRLGTRLRATRSEAKRLNRRSFAGIGLALLAFFSLMTTVITFLAADEMGGGPGFGVQTDLTSAQGLVAGLATAANLFGVIVLALWAAATASDYSTGWIRVLVQAEPRRWRLIGGKLLALTGYTVVGTAVATLISVAVAPYLAGAAGVSTVAWSAGAIGTVLSAWVNLTFSVVVWGVIGVAVATVTRSVTAAIAGGIGYMMVVEGLLGMVLDTSVTAYLPGSVLTAVTSGGNADLAFASAVVLGLAYAVTATVIAGVTFWRRDITS